MTLAAYRAQIRRANACGNDTAAALWSAGEWRALTPLIQGWAALGIPLTLGLSGDDVDDLVALTLVRAWRQSDVPRNVPAWCYTVAYRAALDLCKRPKHVPLLDAHAAEGPQGHEVHPIERTRLRAALKRMDDRYRRCVVLRYLHGRHPNEIADALGLTSGAVKSRIHRGVKMLAALYIGAAPVGCTDV